MTIENNELHDDDLYPGIPTLTEAFAELYKEEYQELIRDGYTYITIMWKRMEIIDEHGYRCYLFKKPIKLVSEVGAIDAPEHCQLIVKHPKIYDDENFVYVEFYRSDYCKMPEIEWAKAIVSIMTKSNI